MTGQDLLRDLLARAAEGDDVALSHLVRHTQPDVWRLCNALGDDADVEDLVQETYLRMIRSIGTFRGDSSVRSWLLAIARNTCADQVRRKTRQRRLIERMTQRAVSTDVAAPAEPDTALQLLSRDRREAFVLTQVLDLSYEDAAEVLGCPIGTIRSRVHRAREDLAEHARRGSIAGVDG